MCLGSPFDLLLDPTVACLGSLGWAGAAGRSDLHFERTGRGHWQELENGEVPAEPGASPIYRSSGMVPTYLREAPALVRLTAFSCLAVGAAIVPTAFLFVVLLLLSAVGLIL